MIEKFFSSDPEGRQNIFPFTKKEKLRCKTVRKEISKYMKPNFKILEAASGNGWASIPLIKRGYDIVMLDIEHWRIKQLKTNSKGLRKNPKIVQCDAGNLPFKKNSFDLVFCLDSLHHLDPKKVLKEFRRILRPKGSLILTEKNYLNPMTWIGDIIFNLKYKIREKTLTKSQISTYLEGAGFSKTRAELIRVSSLPISCPILYLSYGD